MTSRLRQYRQLPVVQHDRFINTIPMAYPKLHWTTDNPSGMSISTPVCIDLNCALALAIYIVVIGYTNVYPDDHNHMCILWSLVCDSVVTSKFVFYDFRHPPVCTNLCALIKDESSPELFLTPIPTLPSLVIWKVLMVPANDSVSNNKNPMPVSRMISKLDA